MKYLITGGCGFLGTNIACNLLKLGEEVILFDSLNRVGSYKNLKWLKSQGEFEFIHGDIRNTNDIEKIVKIIKPNSIYHLAGQVAMTSSIKDPRMDFEVNVIGTFNLINAVRIYSPDSIIIFSSTNKVYGDLDQYTYKETATRYECIEKPNGIDEKAILDFHSPYGSSKGSADQYVLDFARMYELKTVVYRHSTIYGGRQYATYDQGWVAWFTQKAIEIKKNKSKEKLIISGNGKQVRDLLYASDCVNLYLQSSKEIEKIKGQAFNIGGGLENSLSLIELFNFLEQELDIEIEYKSLPIRKSDQKVYIADYTKIKERINWSPTISKKQGIKKMINWIIDG